MTDRDTAVLPVDPLDDVAEAYRIRRQIAAEVHGPAARLFLDAVEQEPDPVPPEPVEPEPTGADPAPAEPGTAGEAPEPGTALPPAEVPLDDPEQLAHFTDPRQGPQEAFRLVQDRLGVPMADREAAGSNRMETTGTTEEPWIDPVMAGAGGFGGTAKVGFSAGLKLAPTLVRSLVSATAGAVADYPIGMATEKVGEKFPPLALPFNIAVGMVSGMTVERFLEDAVVSVLSRKGVGAPARKLIDETVAGVRAKLDAGMVDDDYTAEAARRLNRAVAESGGEYGAKGPATAGEAVRPYRDAEDLPEEIVRIHDEMFTDFGAGMGAGVRTTTGALGNAPGGVRTLASAIPEDLGRTGRVDLRGRPATSAEDVAALSQVYRDPRYETLRVVYVRDGVVAAHEGVTSRLPGISRAFAEKTETRGLYRLSDRMRRLDADGYYLVHNHPSGRLESSPMDWDLTELVARQVPGFQGHVVINSGEFLDIRLTGLDDQGRPLFQESVRPLVLPEGWTDPMAQASMPHPMLGMAITSPDDVALAGKALQAPEGFVTLVYRDANGEVRAIQEAPRGLLEAGEDAVNWLRGQARAFGAQDAVAYAGDAARADSGLSPEAEEFLIREGALLDVVYSGPASPLSVRAARGVSERDLLGRRKSFGIAPDQLPARRVAEAAESLYGPPQAQALQEILGDGTDTLVEISASGKAAVEPFLNVDPAAIPLGDRAVNITFGNLDSPEALDRLFAQVGEAFGGGIEEARRGVVTHEETIRLADDLGLTPAQLLHRRKGQAFNAEQLLAGRRILLASGRRLLDLRDKVLSGTASDLDKFALQKQLNVHYAVQAQVSGMTAEAGRALQALRITAKESAGQLEQIRALTRNLSTRMSPEQIAEALAPMDTVQGVNRITRDLRKATGWDMILESWYNALLSGPVTHAVNVTSNALNAVWQVPERLLAAGIGRGIQAAGGADAEIQAGEAVAQAYGLIEGGLDGLRLFGKVAVSGTASGRFGDKIETDMHRAITAENLKDTLLGRAARSVISPDMLDQGGVAARFADALGEVVRTPGRMLTAEDEMFKAVGYRMELRARAYRTARSEGLDGDAFALRIQEILNDPPDDIAMAAQDAAKYQTFTRDLGKTGRDIQGITSRHPFLKFVVPFVRTPTNIIKFGVERTPLGLASRRIRADIAAGGAARDLALARMSLGTMLMSVTGYYAAQDKITGGGPADPELRAHLYSQGWQPYSIRIGDQYYAYNRLEPLGMLMGMAADVAEISGQLGEEDGERLALAAVLSLPKNLMSKTWLQGPADMIQALDDPVRYGERYLTRLAGSVVPAASAQIERAVDPTMRTADGEGLFNTIWSEIRGRVPGWSDDLPARRNLWGEKIRFSGGLGPDWISPIYSSTAEPNPVDQELLRLQSRIRMPRDTQSIRGASVPLDPLEYDRFMVLMNQAPLRSSSMPLKDTLAAMITSDPRYADASDEAREDMIRDRINEARNTAGEALYEESPVIQEVVRAYRSERANRAMGR